MKNTMKLIAACAASMLVSSTFASGNHAGGHGAASIGVPGAAANVTRTIAVDMSDAMRFTPATIRAKQGETIRFVVKNTGKLGHEFVLGSAQDLKDHYEVMKKHPEMEHADDNMLTVKPGQSGELIWQFTEAGTVGFACLHVGHFDAGMKGVVNVASEFSTGEVKKVDKEAQKITLKHGEIKNLEMPPMTMVFKVSEPAVLDKVKAGDKVNFQAEKRDGVFTVTTLEAVK